MSVGAMKSTLDGVLKVRSISFDTADKTSVVTLTVYTERRQETVRTITRQIHY